MKTDPQRRGNGLRLLILILLAAAALGARQLFVHRSAGVRFDRILICTKCNHIWGETLDTESVAFPVQCPKCREKAGGFAYRCNKCLTVFGFIPQPSAMPICPKCRTTNCSRLTEIP